MTEHERFINEYCRNVGNVKIRCDDCKFVENCVDYGWDGCKKFTPAPSEPQTNEEWIKQANAEQLAEWISSVVQKAISIKENNGIVMLESAIWWVEWLKQKHTNE